MSTTGWIIIALIVIALLAVLAFVVMSAKKKSRHDNHVRAEQLRAQATEKAPDLSRDRAEVERAEREAEEARRAAAQADERAAEARTGIAQQEAVHEDRIRAADRLDPEVDHTADDYSPTGLDEPTQTEVPPHSDPSHHENTHADSGQADPAQADTAPDDSGQAEVPPHSDPSHQENTQADSTGSADSGSGRPDLPRRTPGAQEMPGEQPKGEWGGNFFKRRGDDDSQ